VVRIERARRKEDSLFDHKLYCIEKKMIERREFVWYIPQRLITNKQHKKFRTSNMVIKKERNIYTFVDHFMQIKYLSQIRCGEVRSIDALLYWTKNASSIYSFVVLY
jgi:hypothetical protein